MMSRYTARVPSGLIMSSTVHTLYRHKMAVEEENEKPALYVITKPIRAEPCWQKDFGSAWAGKRHWATKLVRGMKWLAGTGFLSVWDSLSPGWTTGVVEAPYIVCPPAICLRKSGKKGEKNVSWRSRRQRRSAFSSREMYDAVPLSRRYHVMWWIQLGGESVFCFQAVRAQRREKGLPSSESEDDGEAIMDDGKDYQPPEPVKEEPAKKGKKRKKKARSPQMSPVFFFWMGLDILYSSLLQRK